MPATHNDVRQGPSHGHRDRDEEHLVPGRLAARQDLLRGRRSVGAGFGTVPLVKQDPGQRGGDDASNVAEHVACVTAKQTPHRVQQVRSQSALGLKFNFQNLQFFQQAARAVRHVGAVG